MASTILRVCALATLGATLAAAPARAADPTPAPPGAPYREGFLIGFSVGAGGVRPDSCDACGLGFGLELHLGAVASRAVAVMLEGSVLNRGDTTHSLVAVAAQWWPQPAGRWWLKGGIGIGSHSTDAVVILPIGATFDENANPDASGVFPTALAATGVEVVRSGRFTIDVQLRGAATRGSHRWGRSGGLGVGLNWY